MLKKSFKERNPDVDMDEIQNNPNVPEDVKAAITGAMSLAQEEDEAEEPCEEGAPAIDGLETFDDDYIMDMSEDDGKKKNRRRRIDENDEDWLTGRRKGHRPRKSKRKHKKRSKKISENGENGKQTGDRTDKVKKKRVRKSDESNKSLNTTLNSTLDSTLNSSTLNSTNTNTNTNTSFSGNEQHFNNSLASMDRTLEFSGNDSMRKENKQKKTPKKRDSTEKPVNGIVKKTSRRQFTSIPAIMACIEAVVQGNDVSLSESLTDITVKTEKLDETDEQFIKPEMLSPMKPIKLEHIKKEEVDDSISVTTDQKPKKQPRRRSTTTAAATAKNKESIQITKSDETCAALDQSSTMNSSMPKAIVKKSQTNGVSAKQPRTSMKKVKFLS